MTIAVSILPGPQLEALNDAYRKAVARKRLRFTLGAAVFFAALIVASIGAEVNLRTFFSYFGNFISYFDRIFTLENGSRAWTDIGEWFWAWHKWSFYLGQTILISYVGTVSGAVLAFALNFLAAENTAPAPWQSSFPRCSSCFAISSASRGRRSAESVIFSTGNASAARCRGDFSPLPSQSVVWSKAHNSPVSD